MSNGKLTRRRALTLLAATSALPLLPGVRAMGAAAGAAASSTWTGTALGADARLVFAGVPARQADRHVAMALLEVERLEQIFSLYRSDSELSVLNRDGRLRAPSPELSQVLHIARRVHDLSGGLFDPGVEAIWRTRASACERRHVARRFRDVHLGREEVVLPEGAALTLNGIAQGYITDRVVDLLLRAGYRHALVDMGETRALSDAAGRDVPWRIGLADGAEIAELRSGAIATSSADSLVPCAHKGIAHIIDPRTGTTPRYWHSVSVQHPSATWADALSTALFLAPSDAISRVATSMPGARITARTHSGLVQTWQEKTAK